MTKLFWIRSGIAAFFFIMILVGRWISPADELNIYDLNKMDAGKWITLLSFLAFIGYSAYRFGAWVKSDTKKPKT